MFSFSRGKTASSLIVALAAILSATVAAADPPTRVGRTGFVSGSVSFHPAHVDAWTVATLNYPMTTGDEIWTTADGRAELQLPLSVVRLDANTSFRIVKLDDRVAEFGLVQGTLSVSVRDIDHPLGEVIEVDTPNGTVSLLQPGFYRVDVGPPGAQTIATVRVGTARVATSTGDFDLGEARSATIEGFAPTSYAARPPLGVDEWEDWCQWRDSRLEDVLAEAYVSPEVVGYQDLDGFGSWRIDAHYGPIWTPDVSPNWAPYRLGHWVEVEPWGWTWIDDEPWGFATTHYGRWTSIGGRWTWVPASILTRPVYAPALVSFVEDAAPKAASLGADGPVAWFPLAPGQAFVPAYPASPGYVAAINAVRPPDVVADEPARLPAAVTNSQALAVAARNAADRAALEARQAAEQAQLRSRQEEELQQATDEDSRRQLGRHQEREKNELDRKQVRERVQLELQHDKERREAAEVPAGEE